MIAPVAIRGVGKGYTDGHVPDLYAAGSGSVFGMLSPIAWMRQAVSVWIDHPSVEYMHTEGMVLLFEQMLRLPCVIWIHASSYG
jgi:hypothetical protein